MANLVKYNFVVCDEDKRIINSNEIIADKIKELSDASRYVDGEDYDDDFSELLQPDKVEKLLKDKEEHEQPTIHFEEAQRIVDQAHEDANAIIQQAQGELEQLRKQGYSQGEKHGYDAGYQKGMGEVEALKQELLSEKKKQETEYQKQLDDMEPALVNTLIEILEHAFSVQFAEKKDFILHLLQSAFSKIDSSKEYLIRVSREDYPLVQERKDEMISELPKSASVEIVEDLTLNKNQCLIETDGGVFDCSLDTQMDNLTRDLRMLSNI